jgi:PadR family transcriptional regulator AphA
MSPKPAIMQSLEYVLLGMLAQQPRHGYELHKELSNLEGLGLIWRIKQAQLYALLDKLESQGFLSARMITTESHPPRKEYHLTRPGHKVFEIWMLSPVEHGRELRQDFLAKFYFARLLGEETARQVLEAQRKALTRLQTRLENEDDSLSGDQTYEKQVYQFRMKQIQAFIEWLDTCMQENLTKIEGEVNE